MKLHGVTFDLDPSLCTTEGMCQAHMARDKSPNHI